MEFKKTRTNDRGVSTVVSVVLLVALVIIIAAMLSTQLVSQYSGDSLSKSVSSGVTVEFDEQTVGYDATIRAIDMGNANTIIVYNQTGGEVAKINNSGGVTNIGAVTGGKQITIVGVSGDSRTVIQRTSAPSDTTYDVTVDNMNDSDTSDGDYNVRVVGQYERDVINIEEYRLGKTSNVIMDNQYSGYTVEIFVDSSDKKICEYRAGSANTTCQAHGISVDVKSEKGD